LPQTPQLFESDEGSTQSLPQAVSVPLHVGPVPPEPFPPAPVVPPLPPVPGLPLVCGLLQAAARIAKPSPKSHTRVVFISPPVFPGRPNLISLFAISDEVLDHPMRLRPHGAVIAAKRRHDVERR
jgi:hypothetical protein